jgi:hypothetical protein
MLTDGILSTLLKKTDTQSTKHVPGPFKISTSANVPLIMAGDLDVPTGAATAALLSFLLLLLLHADGKRGATMTW